MRKFIFSLKSLAMTLALVVGGSAWAQITSLPFVADFSSGAAPFGEPAFKTGTTAIGDVVAVTAGTAEATFAVGGGAYALGNAEEVTVSFTMFNGWLGGGTDNTFAVLNSDGATLASISYNANNCNIVDVKLGGSTVEGFEAFAGQSKSNVSGKGANGYTHKQTYVANTDEAKNNGEVTIKINSYGGLSLSFVGAMGDVDKFFSATAPAGTKLDLAKLTISNGSNNGDRASGYGNLKVESKSMIKYSNDYSDEVVTWTTATGGRFTPIIQDGYLTVTQDQRNNNGTTITSTETEGKVAEGENFTMSFRAKFGASTNQTATAFNIFDAANSAAILNLAEVTTNATAWTINGGTQTATVSTGGGKGIDELNWIDVKVTSIAGEKPKTYLTLKDAEGNIIDGFDKKDIPALSTTGGLGKMNFVTSRYNANFAIDDIIVRDVVESEDIPATPIYNYTVKFVDQNGEEFKDASVREEYAGVELAITDEDKETVVIGQSQYVYDSDDAAGQTAASDGSTVVTITFNKTTVSNYVVNFLDGEGNPLKPAVTHKNVIVGTKVAATAGELSKFLVDGKFYEYQTGNEPIFIVEDAAANVINLLFAEVADVTGYFFNNYEDRAVDWTTATGGRYSPVVVDGSTIADRATTVQQPKIDPETQEPVTDPETGEPVYENVPGLSIPFANKTYFLTANQAERNNNGVTNGVSSPNFAVDQANFTLETKLILGTSDNQGCSFQIKNLAGDANILQLIPTGVGSTTWVVNGDTENASVELPGTGTFNGTSNDNLSNYIWYDLKVTVYNGVTFVTIVDQDKTVILDKVQVPTLATTYGVSKMIFYTGRYNSNFAVDDVTVRSVVNSTDVPAGAEFIAVKINYLDEAGKALKTPDEQNFKVGDPIELNSSFTADFKVDEDGNIWTAESEKAPVTKYIYVSDNSEDVEVALGAEVNIIFRGVASRRLALRYQIQKVDGSIVTKDASGKNLSFFYDSNKTGDVLFEKDILTAYYPYYLLVDGLLYKTAANGGGTDKVEIEIEPGTNTQTKTPVTWTPAMETVPVIDPETQEPVIDPETQEPVTEEVQISNAVFAQETENIEGITVVKDQYTTIRMANGAAGSAIGGDVLVTTLEPGTYTITTATRSGTTNFKVAGNVVATITSSGTVSTITSDEFTVDQATPLYIEEQASTTQYNDYVLVRQTLALDSYKISVAEGIANGTVEVASSAAAGAVITIAATPDEGYELSNISVTCVNINQAVEVTDGKFTMPADDVTVNATFRKVVYIETDLTKDFIALTSKDSWKSETTSGVGYAEWAAPQVTVAGNKYFMIENYVEGQAVKLATGGVMYNEINGLTPGLYTIELYGSAALTAGRSDMTTDFTEGDDASLHAVTLYAEANGEKVSKYIPCLIESNFNNRGGEESIPTATLENIEVGEDGKIKIGLYKEVGLTNWHIVQLKSVRAQVPAAPILAKAVAEAKNILESQVPAKLYSDIQDAIATYDKDFDTADEYLTAIAALNNIVEVAQAYAPLASVLNEGAQYKANSPAESPAITVYDEAIADVKGAYDAAVVADIPAAIAVVEAALPAIAKAQTAPNSDMTRAIVNPTINGAAGWTTEKPKGGNGPLLNNSSFEYWAGNANPRSEGSFDYYQVIEGLPNGKYVVSAEMYNSLNNEDGAVFAPTSGVYASSGDDETATLVDVDGTTLIRYATEEVFVEDGTLRLGVKNVELPMAARWFVADNFTLTLVEYIAPTYAVNIAEGIVNGTVEAQATAQAGETVALTVTPAEGYELASISVTGVTTDIAVEVEIDDWTGEVSFTMPEDAVTVSATFQEAYVKISNYAIAVDPEFVSDPEAGDEIVATFTYNSEIVGSYAESFMLDLQVYYEVLDAQGEVVLNGNKNPFDVSGNEVTIFLDGLAPSTSYTINVTKVEVTDFDMSTFETVVVFEDVVGLDGNPLATATFTTGLPTGIDATPVAEGEVKPDGKYLENGKIVIYKNGNKYDASGAPMNK